MRLYTRTRLHSGCLALVFLLSLAGCTGDAGSTGQLTPPAPAIDAPTPGTSDPDLLALDFSLSALDGSTITLSQFRGRWALVNFWATWCAPCVAEMPALQALQDRHADRLIVLGINQREDEAQVRGFAADHALRFPLLLHPPDSVVIDYQVMGLPQTILVDPAGSIAYRAFGPLDIEAVEALIG